MKRELSDSWTPVLKKGRMAQTPCDPTIAANMSVTFKQKRVPRSSIIRKLLYKLLGEIPPLPERADFAQAERALRFRNALSESRALKESPEADIRSLSAWHVIGAQTAKEGGRQPKVVLYCAPCLSLKRINGHPRQMAFLERLSKSVGHCRSIRNTFINVHSRQDQILCDMLSIPIEMPKRHWHKSAAPSSDNLAVSSFDQVIARGAKMTQSVSTAALVTPEEMEDHGFPLPSTGYARACLATWDTPPSTAVTSLIALDCEMVELEDFSEGLARVTLVGLEGVLLDLLVKPQMPVRDYRTQFSGVTREMLEGPQAVSFEEAVDRAQHVFNSTPDPIIVGHSLNGDLEVLRLCHPHCIDTTILYPKGGGSLQVKHSLQYLVKTELGLTMDRTSGHDSADDAKAALALTLLKLQFGDNIGEQRQPVAAVPLSYFVRPDLLRGVLENDLPTVPPRKGRLALGFVGGVDVVDSWAHPPGAEYLEGCSMMLGQEGSEQRATSIETSLTLSRSRLVVCVNRQLERLCSERLGLRETVGVDKGGIRSTVDRLRLDARARLLQGLFRADQVVLESRQDVITPATGCVPGEDAERLLRSIRERTDHAAIPDLWVPPVDADELKLVLAEVDKEIAHIALKLEVGDVLLVCSPVGDYARHLSFCRLKHFIEFDSRRLFNQEPAVAGLETDRSMAKLEAEIVGDWRWSQMLQSELERSKSDFQCAFVLSAVKGAGPL